jgi:hypothetical protein
VLDTEAGIITYADDHHLEQNRDYILGGALLIGYAEACMKRLDKAIAAVAELQHRLDPIGGIS